MLKSLTLENFRNHKKITVEFKKVTAIIGPNGVGKSNILEAISLISSCRSFREEDKRNLVNFDSDYTRITSGDLEVFIQKSPTLLFQAKERGVVRKKSDFIGILKSVVFSPETMQLIDGSPRLRRRFLDIMISQKDHDYLRYLIAYEKVRQERNSLLHAIRCVGDKEDELLYWDQELAKNGEILVMKRKEAIKFINEILAKFYSDISGVEGDILQIEYISNAEEDILDKLKENRYREICSNHTAIGPHRDELIFKLNKYNMANYASRGEIRSAVLSLVIAELEYLSDGSGSKPVLLLDDVFSEMDSDRRSKLGALVSAYQTVMTTTDLEHLSPKLLKNAKIITLTQNG
jgi:DNA replication and repair protein RecF